MIPREKILCTWIKSLCIAINQVEVWGGVCAVSVNCSGTVSVNTQEYRKVISPCFCWACASSLLSCHWPTELDWGRQKSPPASCSAGGSPGSWQRSLPRTAGDIHTLLTSTIVACMQTVLAPPNYRVRGMLQVCLFLVTWLIQTFIWEGWVAIAQSAIALTLSVVV